ncbi:MAG TPA: DUF3040 domain-containing protein [Actinomycetota bacterium]|nr:DUF3040 domain-containing protein [Actinomycetota bacterium]
MPLTDREKKILQELERGLYAEDATAERKARSPRAQHVRRIRLGAASFAAGFLILIAFFITEAPIVGVVAFIAMVAGVVGVAGGTSHIASENLDRLQPRERALGTFRKWERNLRERYKRR